jgi:hypothetical protein
MTAINTLASGLVEMCRERKFVDAVDRFYAPNVVSVESVDFGLGKEQRGFDAVRGKNVWWVAHNQVHAVDVAGPYLGVDRAANQFAVYFRFDATGKDTGLRRTIEEMALYTVENGKIVREEYYYPAA